MKRIVLAPDSFKNCLSAPQVCSALRAGLLSADSTVQIQSFPLADGGEGTAQCFAVGTGGRLMETEVHDAYFHLKKACYALSPDGETALVEMAQASGIQGIDKNQLRTKSATTLGTGELLTAACQAGAKRIILGLGGSATTDGGMGALAALGVQFLDGNGKVLSPVGENMLHVHNIRLPQNGILPKYTEIIYACDVTNPFYGENGAAQVFAPQKGATKAEIALLDCGLRHLATCYREAFGKDIAALPSMGAAGGLCGGLYAALGGTAVSGFDVLAELYDLESEICQADLVVTGEGRTDRQTAFGKLPARVAALAKRHGVPCILVSGDIAADFDAAEAGFSTAIALKTSDRTVESAIQNASELLQAAARTLLKG